MDIFVKNFNSTNEEIIIEGFTTDECKDILKKANKSLTKKYTEITIKTDCPYTTFMSETRLIREIRLILKDQK